MRNFPQHAKYTAKHAIFQKKINKNAKNIFFLNKNPKKFSHKILSQFIILKKLLIQHH